ncbi:MAG: DUF4159 domain-containing protein [Rhizobiaceae bacterium]
MSALALSFTSPLMLLGLFAIPLIWWLLRLTPPKPKEEVFPPTRILEDIAPREETPAQSPWWLTMLRLLMAAFVVFALSEPVWNAQENSLAGDGSLLVILDDSWNAGDSWALRKSNAMSLIDEAEAAGRPVALALTSQGAKADLNSALASVIRKQLSAAEPKPLHGDLEGIAQKLSEHPSDAFETLAWLSSGLEFVGTTALIEASNKIGVKQTLYFSPNLSKTQIISQVKNSPDALKVIVERATKNGTKEGVVTAFDLKGRSISSAVFKFTNGKQIATAKFVLPVELRNQVARISINKSQNAGAVQLLDERFRRRRVGLISGGKADQIQPLLSPLYYISRALNPFSEVRAARAANITKAVPELIEEKISTLILADIGTLPDGTSKQLEKWIQKGGMLVRFAGPRLAAAKDDTLVPVELRRGGRSLGGTLTWGTPQPLASFEESSPFQGIPIPKDVTISRQVLAEPGVDLAEKTWASLTDGTPLVTASKRGEGWIVLFHVTADSNWSNLPLSGTFVDMLRRIVAVSNGAIAADRARSGTGAKSVNKNTITMPPLRMLDGFGQLVSPNANTSPLKVTAGAASVVSLENPPGTYGTKEAFVALNLFNGPAGLKPISKDLLPSGTLQRAYIAKKATAIKPWLLSLALLLLALDCLAVLWMAGALRRAPRGALASLLLAQLLIVSPDRAYAQDAEIDFDHTLRTRIAYVITGDQRLDSLSKKGLTGLTQFIAARTSLEPAPPVGVDIAKDELAFYPLLYWPISANVSVPTAEAMARIDAFMKKGGSVLFDTRDQLSGGFSSGQVSIETQKLREILQALDIPPLEPVPENHVLTRAFYLLNVFPGRYLNGKLWVETSETKESNAERPTRQGDGVSSIMITSNDMAGAWAVEASGAPSLPIVPPNPTQRVYAYRAGANIVMYTLTGNYKSDQVHIPALLERLGQ